MQANWSLVLNILLLMGVVFAITRMVKERRRNTQVVPIPPSVGPVEKKNFDDIIAVRKVPQEELISKPTLQTIKQPSVSPVIATSVEPDAPREPTIEDKATVSPVMILLMAKENRQLVGYELLQTLLAAGLRFGDGQLFHRHQHPNGQGPVLCSLAAATATGMFDLQNMGAFSVRGLCLFMHASGNPTIDTERFEIMLDTGRQLSEGLDAHLLDDERRPFSEKSLRRYHHALRINDVCDESVWA